MCGRVGGQRILGQRDLLAAHQRVEARELTTVVVFKCLAGELTDTIRGRQQSLALSERCTHALGHPDHFVDFGDRGLELHPPQLL